MADLPFLVLHGALVWPLVLAVLVLAVVGWRRRRGKPVIAVAGIAAMLAFVVLWGAGKVVMSRARLTHRTLGGHGFDGPRMAYALGNLDALAFAAALPDSRDDALEELGGRFEAAYVRDRATLQRWQALARLQGGCGGELAMLREQERIVELEPLVRACDDDAQASAALLFLGWYREAAGRSASIKAPLAAPIEAQIGARDWAAVVRAVAAFREQLPRNHSLYAQAHPEVPAAIAPRLACAELYFRKQAGEVGAAGKLHEAVGGDPFCKVIDALAQPPDRQGAALVAAYADAPDAAAHNTIEALAWAAGAPLIEHDRDYHSVLVSHTLLELAPIDRDSIVLAVLAPFATAARHDARATPPYVLTHLWQAEHALLRGDLRAAASEPMLAVEGATDPSATEIETAQTLLVSLALRANNVQALPASLSERAYLHPAVMDAVELTRGRRDVMGHEPSTVGHDCEGAETHVVLTSAVDGDAGPLADLAEHCALRSARGADTLFGVWPRLQRDRERLATQISYAAPDLFVAAKPFDVMRRALLRRDLASLVGDTATAAAWQGVLDRHLAALADHDAAVAMILWGLL